TAARPEGLAVDDRVARSRLGQRLPALEPVAAAGADLAPGIVGAHVERPQHHPRAHQGRLTPSSHRAKVIQYPAPMPRAHGRLVWLDLEMNGLAGELAEIVERA